MDRRGHDALKSKIVDVWYQETEDILLRRLGIETREEAKAKLRELEDGGDTLSGDFQDLHRIYTDPNRESQDIVELFERVLGVGFDKGFWTRSK